MSDSETSPELACTHCGGRLEAAAKVYFDLAAVELRADGGLEVMALEFSDLNNSFDGHPVAMESEFVVSCAECGRKPDVWLARTALLNAAFAGGAPADWGHAKRGPTGELRWVVLSLDAHRTICGLVQPSEEIDSEEVFVADEVWAEIRSAFPVAEARVGAEEPAAPVAEAVTDTTRIVVLDDGETFSTIGGCRVYDVPAEWGTEEIEKALDQGEVKGRERQ